MQSCEALIVASFRLFSDLVAPYHTTISLEQNTALEFFRLPSHDMRMPR